MSISLSCSHWPQPDVRWEQTVPAARAQDIVRAFVEDTLRREAQGDTA
ncbi:hypothetical protein ACQEVG_37785 [Streptomyces sp. CA-135486]